MMSRDSRQSVAIEALLATDCRESPKGIAYAERIPTKCRESADRRITETVSRRVGRGSSLGDDQSPSEPLVPLAAQVLRRPVVELNTELVRRAQGEVRVAHHFAAQHDGIRAP
jgi:hypothetical protein